MEKKTKALYIGIAIVTLAVVITVIVYYQTILKPKREQEKNEEVDQEINREETKEVSSSSAPVVGKITNDTILEWKSPILEADRVKWVQNFYNRYVRARKAAGKTPEWPIIEEDGRFGEATHKAVNRIMGKYKTSWTEFKAKVELLTKNLAKPNVF